MHDDRMFDDSELPADARTLQPDTLKYLHEACPTSANHQASLAVHRLAARSSLYNLLASKFGFYPFSFEEAEEAVTGLTANDLDALAAPVKFTVTHDEDELVTIEIKTAALLKRADSDTWMCFRPERFK